MISVQIRILTVAALASAAVFAADDNAAKAKPAAKPAAQSKSAAAQKASALPPGIPKGAKPTSEPYQWRYVDKNGKAWIYHTTPFGVVHDEEPKSDRAAAKADTSMMGDLSVVDQGETYAFTLISPFGPKHWTVKKSEMTETDQANLKQAQAKATAAASVQQSQ